MKKIAQGIDFIKNMQNKYKLVLLILIVLTLVLSLFCCRGNNIEPAAKQLIELTDIIRHNFNNKPDFWKLNTKWLIDNKALPKSMNNGDKAVNALGKEVIVGLGIEGQVLMPGTQSFDIVYRNLDYDECVTLATYNFSEQEMLGLLSMTIINGAEEKQIVWGENEGLPISVEEAETICSKKNMIIWNFK